MNTAPVTTVPAGETPADRAVVQAAFARIADRADDLVRMFYAELFHALGDEAFTMFPPGMARQREDFGRALVQWVVADDPDTLRDGLEQLGADHRKFGVDDRHYQVAGDALVAAWSRLPGASWTPEIEASVVASYTRLATTMIDAAHRHRDQPASWGATVVGHRRLGTDVAVICVQPDAPYVYRAGQYCTVEVASLPKQWRQMSFASAPRPDNTFELQVRAVAATGVSGALVAHTRVGDRLQLGAPRGNDLVVEPGTIRSGLLCIAAGTGAAPITAVVESLVHRPGCPPTRVFVGGRTRADLHSVQRLDEQVSTAGLLGQVRVYGVVSEDPTYPGLHGRVETVVPPRHPWAQMEMDVLIAGPDRMIADTVQALRAAGVPEDRLRFDQYDVDAARHA